jgi:hypothetical protein
MENRQAMQFPLLPLRDIVVFPQMIVPLFVGRDKSVVALEKAMEADKEIFLVSQLDPAEDDPDREAWKANGVLQVERKIRNRVKRQMEKTQREYYLNEQMKAIQRELGDGDDGANEIAELEEKIEEDQAVEGSPRQGQAELKKLRTMSPMSRRSDRRAQLSRLAAVGLPWGKKSKVKKDLAPRRRCSTTITTASRRSRSGSSNISRCRRAHQQAEGPDPVPRRPSGRRQDLARQVDRQGDGARVRAHVAGRRARRGRDPRPPPHLYRLDARQGHPVLKKADAATRCSCSTRSTSWARTSAAIPSSALLEVLDPNRTRRSGPLSGGRLRPVGRDVRHHGQQPQHAAAAARPHGDHPARRLHRGREGRDRQAPPDLPSSRSRRTA